MGTVYAENMGNMCQQFTFFSFLLGLVSTLLLAKQSEGRFAQGVQFLLSVF